MCAASKWLLNLDTRTLEYIVGTTVALEGIWCLAGQWFTTTYIYHGLAGYEWAAAVAGVTYGAINAIAVNGDMFRLRALLSLTSLTFIAVMGGAVIDNLGWRVAGLPVCIVSGFAMLIVYVKMNALHEQRTKRGARDAR